MSVVQWPDGHSDGFPIRTSTRGIALQPLTFTGQPQGRMILADVTCSYKDLSATSRTSFRIWY
jgi:hypothetical protein